MSSCLALPAPTAPLAGVLLAVFDFGLDVLF